MIIFYQQLSNKVSSLQVSVIKMYFIEIHKIIIIFTQGLAFTLEERISLGIHGLQPPRFKTQEEQLALCKASVMKYTEDLNRYLYLVELQVK